MLCGVCIVAALAREVEGVEEEGEEEDLGKEEAVVEERVTTELGLEETGGVTGCVLFSETIIR